jgi:hypothetical protein
LEQWIPREAAHQGFSRGPLMATAGPGRAAAEREQFPDCRSGPPASGSLAQSWPGEDSRPLSGNCHSFQDRRPGRWARRRGTGRIRRTDSCRPAQVGDRDESCSLPTQFDQNLTGIFQGGPRVERASNREGAMKFCCQSERPFRNRNTLCLGVAAVACTAVMP